MPLLPKQQTNERMTMMYDFLWGWIWLGCKLSVASIAVVVMVAIYIVVDATPRHEDQPMDEWVREVYDNFQLACKRARDDQIRGKID